MLRLAIISFFTLAQCQWSLFDLDQNHWETVERDVCVVGGGSSGTYAAVRLTDMNQTVAVVERNDYLGGHASTYIDPATEAPVNLGVVIFQPWQIVRDYYGRFDIPLLNLSAVESNTPGEPVNKSLPALLYETVTQKMDFQTGRKLPESPPTDMEGAFERFAIALEKYQFLLDGYNLPDPVPEDLYMPFGAFVEKYNLDGAVPLLFAYSQGMGDMLNIPAIYVIKYFNLQDVKNLKTGWLTPSRGSVGELFSKAGQYIGKDNIFLQSSIVAMNRTGQPQLLISSNSGLTLLSCGKVLLTIPPTLQNLAGWDLTAAETSAFSEYISSNGYWTGLVKNIGLNETMSYVNGAEDKPYSLPVLPALYGFSPVGVIPGVWQTLYGSSVPTLTDDQVKAAIVTEIHRIQSSEGVPLTEPEFLVFHSHTPFQLQVKPEAIKGGFYRDLSSLQGTVNTWYTGAAFHTHDSSFLWRFTEDVVLPKLMAG